MLWTAPDIDRPRQATAGGERQMLQSLLVSYRHTLLRKCQGLTAEQLKTHSVDPSNLSLLGLVRHMTDVERGWFRRRMAEQSIAFAHRDDTSVDGAFDNSDFADAEADYALYRAEFALCDQAVADLSLDHTCEHPHFPDKLSLRWVFLHMIGEYARHCGHADLLRERIDGATGL